MNTPVQVRNFSASDLMLTGSLVIKIEFKRVHILKVRESVSVGRTESGKEGLNMFGGLVEGPNPDDDEWGIAVNQLSFL